MRKVLLNPWYTDLAYNFLQAIFEIIDMQPFEI